METTTKETYQALKKAFDRRLSQGEVLTPMPESRRIKHKKRAYKERAKRIEAEKKRLRKEAAILKAQAPK